MNTENPYKSVIRMKKTYVSDFSFSRAENIKNLSYNFKLGKKIDISDGCNVFVELECKVNSGEDFNLDITIVGLFELETNEPNEMLKKNIAERNTIAILFPFLRSQIMLLTAQPDLEPIVLPVINVNALFEEPDES